MLSPIPSRPFDITDNPQWRYSFSNIQVCPKLKNELADAAVRHLASNMLKSLYAIERSEIIQARNKVDIPMGLFGLSLENFYRRRKQKIVYLDILKMVCRVQLEQAKVCIVIDDLINYITRLFDGYRRKNLAPILKEISKSMDLLTVHDDIIAEYNINSAELHRLYKRDNLFHIREQHAIAHMDNEVDEAQNNYFESELVLDPIECRYKVSFHNRTVEQAYEFLYQTERKLHEELENLTWTNNRDATASECIRLKQNIDVEILKKKLEKMVALYDRDYEQIDGQIQYKSNSMDIMREQRKDCIAKMAFFEVEKVKLIEWLNEKRKPQPRKKKKTTPRKK